MSVFGEREFSITPVRGIRTFRVTEDGRLLGHTGHEWSSGINVASCSWILAQMSGKRLTGLRPRLEDDHDMATCSCGFYAYHDGISDYGVRGDWLMHGVIEGSGKTTIGERGFRTERARLLALSPPAAERDLPWPLTKKRLNYLMLVLTVVTLSAMFVGDTDFMLSVGFDSARISEMQPVASVVQWTANITAALIAGFAVFVTRRGMSKSAAFRREASAPVRELDEKTAAVVAAVRERYPDVVILGSLGELLAQYPPDPIPGA